VNFLNSAGVRENVPGESESLTLYSDQTSTKMLNFAACFFHSAFSKALCQYLYMHLTILCFCGNLRTVAFGAALAPPAALGGDGGVGLQFLGVFGSC